MTSRVANCLLTEISQPLDRLITGLNLRNFEAFKNIESMENLRSPEEKNEFRNYHRQWSRFQSNLETDDKSYTCRSLKNFNDLKLVKVYGNLDRSPELVLEGNGAFEHFFLYHRLDTNEACIHFTYAYG